MDQIPNTGHNHSQDIENHIIGIEKHIHTLLQIKLSEVITILPVKDFKSIKN